MKLYIKETIKIILIAFFIIGFAMSTIYAETKIGQATNGENGKLKGCIAGDQSGGEVSISKWGYSSSGAYNWKYVLRAKDKKIAKQLAENMIKAADNNYIGYDQNSPDRNTFYDEAEKVDWDISKITTNCETTCSSAVSVCLNASGVKVPREWYSGLVKDDVMATGQFDCFTSSDYVASDAKLLPGDILVSPGYHVAMVVESDNKYPVIVTYSNHDKTYEDYYDEGQEIVLQNNNSTELVNIVLSDDISLDKYIPSKKGFAFSGWEKKDGGYNAKYTSELMPLHVNGERKKIK